MSIPEVSVVMGVYNGAESLAATIESILNQLDVTFEFIIVDDASTDDSGLILQDYSRKDERIRVIGKNLNQGLTMALREGCEMVRGQFIARQDCGDRSLSGRLALQVAAFRNQSNLKLHCGGVRYVVDNEVVLERCMNTAELNLGLSGVTPGTVFGPPHHGATMFTREAYMQVGGYRPEFYFAQDLDLWLRLSEVGEVDCFESVIYEALLESGSISGKFRSEQEHLKKLALKCRNFRSLGRPQDSILEIAKNIRPEKRHYDVSKGDYFIGRLMETVNEQKALSYYQSAIDKNPLNWKAWIRSQQLKLKMRIS